MIDRLIEKINQTKNPSVVGLDPVYEIIPGKIKTEMLANYGQTPQAVAEMFIAFNRHLIDSLADIVPAVKLHIAMYEKYGFEGIRAYAETTRYAKEKGLIVIGDAKHGDVTAIAQAHTSHLNGVSIEGNSFDLWSTDAVTINPYIGAETVKPFIDVCNEHDKGIFVLVKTSNSSSSDFQELDSPQQFSVTIGETKGQWTKSMFVPPFLFERVALQVNKWGEEVMGTNGYSKVGAIVGATSRRNHVFGEYSKRIRSIMPKTFFLVPDYDSEGATTKDVKKFFDKNGSGCIVCSSHGIISAHMNESKYEDHNFADAAREAAIKMKDALTL